MTYYHRLIINFDGASRRNPHGPAGCGWVIHEMNDNGSEGNFIAKGQKYLGHNISNNQAEYEGIEAALQYMVDNGIECYGLYIRGDSEVVINQLDGVYEVRSPNIRGYYNTVVNLLGCVSYHFVKYRHVERHMNDVADELANDAIHEMEDGIWTADSDSDSDWY
mmetsp:Transcript_12959/g.19743  ORF Transcript_12959/g.19743 Transcript_12959/m.19743 type:complete len:164 (+) Transcript_12959:212-703(+)|eukprot:CAMPEP_0196815190 /NCGR_PEP_ID=MMETSP1362-20130617/48304_1 /TAXON_ID=163516 /ORGANISM="Leptocylindrus danicus, Strain CCMP1856" /LENGTH=163 /DNA_ID=CAMNT_0042192055 /DNA_START=147 /DNA_END=641 /DNA_ORIENTATION=+